ncbi:DUF4041 domain-containing protein [Spirulina sp. CCNP1310]|uniref:DUF4041 domain-containing protein n=1 Tax=Spirulina sp. CCNP1310 TaxID=3110249 RepID=UPI002B2012B6|nr:DUF4041 domain-containing protein [Spirulina sp. CCNP1310]MEA5420865.1 DUF4041 domain-containing protein [Spirulina sp. CCNP1310]
MAYLFFLLSCVCVAGWFLAFQNLESVKKEASDTKKRLSEEASNIKKRLSDVETRFKRLNIAYGDPISREDKLQKLNSEINSLVQKIKTYQGILSRAKNIAELDHEIENLNLSIKTYQGILSRAKNIAELDHEIENLNLSIEQLRQKGKAERENLSFEISLLKAEFQALEEKNIIEGSGFYESKYDFQESEFYKNRLDEIRSQQKQMIKNKIAVICHTSWTVQGSEKQGKKMTDDFIKLVLRAFNGECDAAVMKVKYNNIQTMENRIQKAYDSLNKVSVSTHCEITANFLNLKLQELYLTHEYQEKKQQEQEEQRAIREQMREEEKALREIEKAKEDAEKEELRYQKALEKARKEIESATGKAQETLLKQIEELQQRVQEAGNNKERAISQAQMTKSGHVYIISNLGSFGDNVYKIGMTRRLDPVDRVKELSSASVPFPFDIHAMIYSKNAPALESNLHKYFEHKRVNQINNRKEFFKVSLDEIVKAVKEIDQELINGKSEIQFTKIAEAAEYRKTLAKESDRQDSP